MSVDTYKIVSNFVMSNVSAAGLNMGSTWGRQDPGMPHVAATWTLLSGLRR